MATATSTGGDLFSRAIRAAKLETAAYEEVEHDETATVQAGIVVVVSAVAAAVGFAGATASGAVPAAGAAGTGVAGIIVSEVIAALLGWVAYAYAAFLVGTTILKGHETRSSWGEVARTLGFASAPRTLLILIALPGLFVPVSIVVAIWLLVATVVAVRSALDVGTGRGLAISVVAWLALAIVSAVIGSLL